MKKYFFALLLFVSQCNAHAGDGNQSFDENNSYAEYTSHQKIF